jgi:2,3-bisphosphoglycerate-independent phosphoglycerate mutase
MKAKEITDKAIELLEAGTNFIVMNYANADMVGHSGNEEATIKAIEAIDIQLKRLVGLAISRNVPVFITADHGNAETNVDPKTGIRHTAHTNNPVPAILTIKDVQLKDGGLADVAPTILKIFNIEKPSEMTGNSLIA